MYLSKQNLLDQLKSYDQTTLSRTIASGIVTASGVDQTFKEYMTTCYLHNICITLCESEKEVFNLIK